MNKNEQPSIYLSGEQRAKAVRTLIRNSSCRSVAQNSSQTIKDNE
jgi:hypothetical protein